MGLWKKPFGKRKPPPPELQQRLAQIDAAFERYASGEEPDEATLEACHDAHYAFLSEQNGTDDNTEFDEQDQVDMYLIVTRLTALRHPSHTAWPFIDSTTLDLFASRTKIDVRLLLATLAILDAM